MVKRLFILTAATVLSAVSVCFADLIWKNTTPAQTVLKNYIESANAYLEESGEKQINRIFELYPGVAVLGITETDDAEEPEDVEITVTMLNDRIDQLQLRVCTSPDRFSVIASCLIRALYGENITSENAAKAPEALAERASNFPDNSYEEPVEELSGRIPRFYFAYYPDQYHDARNWLQMTVIFPMDTLWNGNEMIIGSPEERGIDPESGVSEDYEGYFSQDDYNHYEVFMTATPEPDSAAAEYDFR